MKGTVRIISGSLKGRVIPFNINKYNDADITPQKVKGALFSFLGEFLTGKTFIDLFSGSGQIGIEALSRDCEIVVINEKDRHRLDLIGKFIKQVCDDNRVILLSLHAKSALRYLLNRKIMADIIFLDPLYNKEKGTPESYSLLLEDVIKSGILKDTSIVIIQHFSANELPVSMGCLIKTDVKKYGTTSLSVYCISAV